MQRPVKSLSLYIKPFLSSLYMGQAYLSLFYWYTVPSPILSMVVWYCTPPHVLYVCGCGQVEIANRQAVTREADDHKGLWEQEVLSRSKLGLRVSLAWRCHCSSLFVLSSSVFHHFLVIIYSCCTFWFVLFNSDINLLKHTGCYLIRFVFHFHSLKFYRHNLIFL